MSCAAENITRHFGGDWHGSYGSMPTPGHSPKDRGTTVKMGDTGDVIFFAHNDPSMDWRALKDECRSLGLIADRERSGTSGGGWRETGSYTYRDASGAVLYRTVRKEKPGADKRFEAQRLEGRQWINGMGNVERIPYRLPELLATDPAEPIFFVEGERKADKLARWGMSATAIPFGAKGWRDSYKQHFAGRRVIVLPDNDGPGREFANRLQASLREVANSVVVIDLPGLPQKGDIIDWTGTADDLRQLADRVLNAPSPMFPLADLLAWDRMSASPKSFVMAGYVPARELTLATGKGGANKSTFGQQLATCVAAGIPMLGVDVEQSPSLYITAEDDEDRLHWMQQHICRALRVHMGDLAGTLHLASLRGRLGNELATFDGEGKLRPSPCFGLLKATIAQTGAKFVVLDNAAHLFAGNENDRGQVTAFVNLLYSLCVDLGVTIILVAHSNKAGDSYSGSTAWLNAVRSQIVLARPEGSLDPDERVLSLDKANYARQGDELRFRWHDFALVRDEDLASNERAEIASAAASAAANARFLDLLAKATTEKRNVSASRSARNYAPRVFAGMTGAKGMKAEAFEGAMERLLHLGHITAEGNVFQRANRAWVSGIVKTEVAPTPAPTMHQPPAPTRTGQHHQPAPGTHPYTTYRAGGASAAPAPAEYRNGNMILAPGETGDEPIHGWEDMR